MTFQVTVQPSGRQFTCEDDETVLAAAIRAGVGLPYGCKNGACGSCKGKLLEGSPISAADIADYIHQQVAAGEFLILPHEAGRQAWQLKRQAPERLYDEMAEMAVKMRAKAQSR